MTQSNKDSKKSLTYSDSGVNIDAGNELAKRIKSIAKSTHNDGVVSGIGGFASLYNLPSNLRNPLLVSTTDGVGTKLKLAGKLKQHDSVGVDLVAMCVNDIIVYGAKPLFFLDYFATSKLNLDLAEGVIAGIASGCEIAGCALVGGETAEMPGMYHGDEYELVGFALGVVERDNLIQSSRVKVGDVVLGLASSGVHSNGFSLIRKILESGNHNLSSQFEDSTLGETLLTPTRIYVKSLLKLLDKIEVSALAHITGGGLLENLQRVLPQGVIAEIHREHIPKQTIFEWLQQNGNILDNEMLRTFNCGVGMVVVVHANDAEHAIAMLEQEGETVFSLGEICASDDKNATPEVRMV